MTRPWIVIASSACALLAIGLGIQHFRSSSSDVHSTQHTGAFREPTRTDRGGWIAQAGQSTESQAGGGTRPRVAAPGLGSGAADVRGRSKLDAGNAPGAAVVVGGGLGGRVGGGVGSQLGMEPSGEGIQVNSSVPAAQVPFEGALPAAQAERLARNGGSETVRMAANPPTGGQGTAGAPEDPNAPVLSLPLTNSPEPDKGNATPIDEGVSYDGHGATFSTDSKFVVPDGGNISGDAGTISFTVQPQWGGGDEGDASLVQLRDQNAWDNRLQIFKNGMYLRFLMTDNTGHESNVGAVIDQWQPNEPHQITATWNQEQSVQSFYVDGRLVGQQTLSAPLQVRPGTPLMIGSDVPGGGPGAGATMSNFQVYNHALGPDEVSNLFASQK